MNFRDLVNENKEVMINKVPVNLIATLIDLYPMIFTKNDLCKYITKKASQNNNVMALHFINGKYFSALKVTNYHENDCCQLTRHPIIICWEDSLMDQTSFDASSLPELI